MIRTYKQLCEKTQHFTFIPLPKDADEYTWFKLRFFKEYGELQYIQVVKGDIDEWALGEDPVPVIGDEQDEILYNKFKESPDHDDFLLALYYFDKGRIQVGLGPSDYCFVSEYDQFTKAYENLSKKEKKGGRTNSR